MQININTIRYSLQKDFFIFSIALETTL